MKETKVYVVKHPQGAYEDYQEPIVKVFLNEKEAKSYVKEENAKLPLEQAKKCDECYFKWTCVGQKGKKIPSCFNGNEYNYCENYFKYHDIQELFIEKHEIDDIKDHDRELVKEVCEKIIKFINELAWKDIQYDAFQSTIGEFSGSTSAIPRYAKKYFDLWKQMFGEDLENKG